MKTTALTLIAALSLIVPAGTALATSQVSTSKGTVQHECGSNIKFGGGHAGCTKGDGNGGFKDYDCNIKKHTCTITTLLQTGNKKVKTLTDHNVKIGPGLGTSTPPKSATALKLSAGSGPIGTSTGPTIPKKPTCIGNKKCF